ncbi:type I glyceraldehyde-3-phosphate dehydrogenase [Sedimentisphaera salicampi]|uniref:Glyceraldehyde-3-phosphate dehydrogenase n=1 Tax=Sedimentisphaera salicampi TaxID=1941349 RepID=A0A1W6LLQ1_9BACT|nr:type I glyceraldehyde-3-phosphate dehydrogenase [Sedimentisphaera salicampi]ARN56673.1 Glyceraldehyde-3-phosphate dehydrogenase [Sedimentisphaera salicampi]OXU15111.1 Glyceraldehyde-3-phosphate dehydrogenase [Sedimentisphaera salicampi]
MATKVAINGFGRIGRAVARVILQNKDLGLDLVAINDLADPKALAHLFKYDTVMGKWEGEVSVSGDGLVVNGKDIKVTAVKSPSELPWKEMGVDIVLESTGIFRTKEGPKGGYGDHIKAGAKKVVLSVPAKDEIDGTIVLGVNDSDLTKDIDCASNASCTTNCLAPVAKVLNDSFGIKRGLMTTIHAYTNDQNVGDMIHKDLRRARAAADNIIPTTTGAAVAVGKVIPDLNGKLNGGAMRVPVIDGSCVDLTVELGKDVTAEDVNAAVKAAADGPMKGVMAYCEDPIVSSDIVGDPHSSIFDALSTMVIDGNMVKVISWYDNEWGYSNRAADLMSKMASML